MIICICSATSDSEVIPLAKSGFTKKEIIKKTGACQNCKICCAEMKSIIEQHTPTKH